MKYICTDCGATFDEPHEYEERHGFTHGPFEKWSVCPYCGNPRYEESVICDRCGKTVARSEIYHDIIDISGLEKEVCTECHNELEEDK